MSHGFFVKTIRAWWVGENTIQDTVRNERDGERARDGTEEERVRHVSPFLLTQRLSAELCGSSRSSLPSERRHVGFWMSRISIGT